MLKRKHPDWFREDLLRLFELLKQDKLQPIIHSVISLDQVAEAHQVLQDGGVVGKIIIVNEQDD
jgi:NADPH:quinone reductase-like Zn-dependent oxidoreductase